MVSKKENEFFVNIENPVEARRGLLESSRDAIHMLQSYEKIKMIRDEKNKLLQDLDNTMRDIYSLSNRLRTHLPKLPAKKKEGKAQKRPEPEREVVKKAPVVVKQNIIPKDKSALELLEEELLNVEKQLNEIK